MSFFVSILSVLLFRCVFVRCNTQPAGAIVGNTAAGGTSPAGATAARTAASASPAGATTVDAATVGKAESGPIATDEPTDLTEES